MAATNLCLFYITCPDSDCAEKLGRQAIEEKLAACVNILPGMKSIYLWKNKLEESSEAILILKATENQFGPIETFLKQNHPYEAPCLLQLPVGRGSNDYTQWLLGNLSKEL